MEGKVLFKTMIGSHIWKMNHEKSAVSGYDEEKIRYKIAELKTAFENSKLPETPNEEPFRDFLYRIRYENLMGRKY